MTDPSGLSATQWDFRAALDYVFTGFNQHRLQGLADRDLRQPEPSLEIARQCDCLPVVERTITVTGSKGKGTTARLIARYLTESGYKVGLLLSPEERQPTDRMRINNTPIDEAEFVQILAEIKPHIETQLQVALRGFYFSPAAIFLLIALRWFHQQAVDYWVLETARGARYDEVGRLAAKVSIITSLLAEHLPQLGPTIEQLVEDKLAIGLGAKTLLLTASTAARVPQSELWSQLQCKVEIVSEQATVTTYPSWYGSNHALAQRSLEYLLDRAVTLPNYPTPGYGCIAVGQGRILYEAAIHPDCIDKQFLIALPSKRFCALVALADQKEWVGVVAKLQTMGFLAVQFLLLSSDQNYFTSDQIGAAHADQIAGAYSLDNETAPLKTLVDGLVDVYSNIYVVGIQQFLRQLRRAYDIRLV